MLPITIVVGQPRFKSGKKKVPFDQAYGHSIALHCMVTCHVFFISFLEYSNEFLSVNQFSV